MNKLSVTMTVDYFIETRPPERREAWISQQSHKHLMTSGRALPPDSAGVPPWANSAKHLCYFHTMRVGDGAGWCQPAKKRTAQFHVRLCVGLSRVQPWDAMLPLRCILPYFGIWHLRQQLSRASQNLIYNIMYLNDIDDGCAMMTAAGSLTRQFPFFWFFWVLATAVPATHRHALVHLVSLSILDSIVCLSHILNMIQHAWHIWHEQSSRCRCGSELVPEDGDLPRQTWDRVDWMWLNGCVHW